MSAMAATDHNKRITALLSNAALARLDRLRLQPRRRLTEKRRGEHLSGRSGSSNEFSDYRDYVAGDDVRFLDWNILARLHRPYMKLYLEEQELHVAIVIDASTSMNTDGKLVHACRLAAALAVVALGGGERVSLHVFHGQAAAPVEMGPLRGRAARTGLFAFLERVEGGGDAGIDKAVDRFLARQHSRGVVVLLSDFFTRGDLTRVFNGLFSAGREVWAIQVTGPSEQMPELAGDARLVDCETEAVLDVSITAELLHLYHDYRLGLERNLEALARSRGGRFVSVSTEDEVEWILFDLMRRRGWLR